MKLRYASVFPFTVSSVLHLAPWNAAMGEMLVRRLALSPETIVMEANR